jgi:hypothetical protein
LQGDQFFRFILNVNRLGQMSSLTGVDPIMPDSPRMRARPLSARFPGTGVFFSSWFK